MNDVTKNRFLIWLMWLLPVACTGWFSISVWTMWQLYSLNRDLKCWKYYNTPLKERPHIAEMNKSANLTKEDELVLSSEKNIVKVKEGVYVYDWKQL